MVGIKNDKLDAMMLLASKSLTKEISDEWDSIDDSDVEYPKSLDRRIQKLIHKERQRREFGTWYIIGKRVVAVFLIICTLSLGMILSVEAVREKIWETILKWYEDYIAISHVVESAPEVIETKKEPSVIPANWEKVILTDNNYMYAIQYMADDDRILIYNQLIIDDSNILVDNNDINIQEIRVGSYIGNLLYTSNNAITIIWSDGEYNYLLTTYSTVMNEKKLIEIANSVE